MTWVLVTGGVCSGIGKGCVAAMVARTCARAGLKVTYRKLEPCLQGEIAEFPNIHFGEILRSVSGDSFDGDVARAAFYVPNFSPDSRSDVSLGRLLGEVLSRSRGSPAPRLHEIDPLLAGQSSELAIVEVGGTAGELEHRILCESLHRAMGAPLLHVHLTALVESPSGRLTSKPAQLSWDALVQPASLVLVRGAADGEDSLAPLRAAIGNSALVMGLAEDRDWPERAVMRVLTSPPAAGMLKRTLGVEPVADPLFDTSPAAGLTSRTGDVVVVHDGAGAEGYASLAHRLRAWSKGWLRIQWQTEPGVPTGVLGVIRIGERAPPPMRCPAEIPVLDIVPGEQGLQPRDMAARPDWEGTAEAPVGAVALFVERVMATPMPLATPASFTLAYADPGFAALYLQASQAGGLRDHASLDALVARSLPAGERLHKCRLLDVGCGAGRWSARLVAAGAREVVGVEPAPPMADAAAALGLERFRLVRERIETFEPEGTFDAILASMSLDHVEDLAPVLRRLAAHLAPRGRLIVSTEHPLTTVLTDADRVKQPEQPWSGPAQGAGARLYALEPID